MAAGILILLRLSPFDLIDSLLGLFRRKRPSLRKKVKAARKPKKVRGIQRILRDAEKVLQDTNQSNKLSALTLASMVLFIFGLVVAAALDNVYLIPVLAVSFALLPFLYILYSANKYRKELVEVLETALSTVTNSYIRSENLMQAIKENLHYMNSPAKEVFSRFVNRVEFIDPDIVGALEDMKNEIDNSIFQEWVEALILCQNDRNLKTTLHPIVTKISKVKDITSSLELELYKPVRAYITMVGFLGGILVAICFVNSSWSHFLLGTNPGKLALAITAVVTIVSLARVIRLIRPIEYKR